MTRLRSYCDISPVLQIPAKTCEECECQFPMDWDFCPCCGEDLVRCLDSPPDDHTQRFFHKIRAWRD